MTVEIDNDITRALKRQIERLQTQRKLMPYPPHEFTLFDLEIGNKQYALRRALQWSLYQQASLQGSEQLE
jgi:hypothetical protein